MATLAIVLQATAAIAVDEDDGGAHVTIETPAYVTGDLWASNSGVFVTITRQHSCWYPQGWWDDAVAVYEDGAVLEYNTASRYFDIVRSVVTRVIDEGTREPASAFAEIDVFDNRSCIQATFIGRDDCSTDEMIGVLSTASVRDAYRGVNLETGSFDDHDIAGLYCLVVIEREPWLEIVRDNALIPEPQRATFPQFRTLVGLENRVWYEVAPGLNPVTGGFSVAIPTTGNDYGLTLDVWLTGVRIDIDGDDIWDLSRECADEPTNCVGSEQDPVFLFEYELRGLHAFTIQTIWAGQATGPTGEVLNINPGMLLNDFAFDWETVEVRSSLDG
jgi:hypothetical protein